MKRTLPVVLAPVLLLGALLGVLWLVPHNPSREATKRSRGPSRDVLLQRGRTLYQTHCSSCHGSEGRGKGPAARFLNPPPMNFHGSRAAALSDREMMRIIAEGKPRTGMPAWKGRLSRRERRWIVRYVREAFGSDGRQDPGSGSSSGDSSSTGGTGSTPPGR